MSTKLIFNEAKKRFFDSGKLLSSILGFGVFLFSAVFSLIIADVVYLFVSEAGAGELVSSIVLFAVLSVLLVLITMPTFFGYLSMLHSMYKGDREVCVAYIFKPFTSVRKYIRSAFMGVRLLIRSLVVFGVPLFVALFAYFGIVELIKTNEDLVFLVELLAKAVAVIIFVFLYPLLSLSKTSGYLGAYCFMAGMRSPYKESKRILKGKVSRAFALKLVAIPLIALSVLSIGTLFCVTVPIISFSYFIYAENLIENRNNINE